MKNAIKIFFAFALAVAFTYVAIAFVLWEPDPELWDSVARYFLAVAALVSAIVSVGLQFDSKQW